MSTGVPGPALPDTLVIDDCWNRIGVYGDSSCPILPAHVHCRNCPVYAAAAVRMLDRERGEIGREEELQQATHLFAGPRGDEAQRRQSAFVFRISSEWLALVTSVLDEVADLRNIHSLPHRRSGVVLGLANVRGELLVCVSLAQLLGIESRAEAKPSRDPRVAHRRLLVVRNHGSRLAFPVDEVHGTQAFDAREVQPVPSTVAKAAASYSQSILPWQGHAVGLLDDELLFHSLNRSLA